MKQHAIIYIGSILLLTLSAACKKENSVLKEPNDTYLLTINSLENAQSVLDKVEVMRETPALSEISADDYFLPPDSTPRIKAVEYNAYLWKTDIFPVKDDGDDWFYPYQQVYYANSVLAALPGIAATGTQAQLNFIRGMALFIRAYAFYNLVIEFAELYDNQAANNPGIPISTTPESKTYFSRGLLTTTYDQILKDLQEARTLLPATVDAKRKNRPSQPAVDALLARIYLSMRKYDLAKQYADSCLQQYPVLIDYNNISLTATIPFTISNEETLYQSNLLSRTDMFLQPDFYVDTTLYRSYASPDRRRAIYFTLLPSGYAVPKSDYTGNRLRFSGLATDEVYLIRAECQARAGHVKEAMDDLNYLLVRRWEKNSFISLVANSTDTALAQVLTERRKELVFRGLRWTDIRRLNKENRGISLKRLVKGKEYTLPAGDNRFVLPIPPDVISSNKDMKQNPR